MKRRDFLRLAAGGDPAAPLAAAADVQTSCYPRGDLGYADTGFTGCKDFPTPYIDRLAHSGIGFTNAYASHPFCSPTRAGLLTGRYPQRFGYEDNPIFNPHNEVAGLPTSEITIADLLSNAGYVTGQIGKWHLGAAPQFHPLKRGFKEQFGFLSGSHDYFKSEADNPDAPDDMIPIERDGKPVQEKEYLTDAFSREACEFVARHAREPFFLYLAYSAPHSCSAASLSRSREEHNRPYPALVRRDGHRD